MLWDTRIERNHARGFRRVFYLIMPSTDIDGYHLLKIYKMRFNIYFRIIQPPISYDINNLVLCRLHLLIKTP